MFDFDGNEIKNHIDASGTVVVCARDNVKGFYNYYSNSNYCLNSKSIKLGEAVNIGNDIFVFSDLQKPRILRVKHEDYYIQANKPKKRIPVYSEVDCLQFESELKPDDVYISINGTTHSIKAFLFERIDAAATVRYTVRLGIDKADIYNILLYELVNGKKELRLNETIGYDPALKVDYFKINDNEYSVRCCFSKLL